MIYVHFSAILCFYACGGGKSLWSFGSHAERRMFMTVTFNSNCDRYEQADINIHSHESHFKNHTMLPR